MMIKRLFSRNGKAKSTSSKDNDLQPLEAGKLGPEFSLPSTIGDTLTSSELRGRPAVLVFYPADESSVCSNQLALYNEAHNIFQEYDAQMVGISVDNIESHEAFASFLNLRFPLLADDDPLGATAREFGVFNERDGVSERAIFVVDADGVICWSHLSNRSVNPGANGILEALESLAPVS